MEMYELKEWAEKFNKMERKKWEAITPSDLPNPNGTENSKNQKPGIHGLGQSESIKAPKILIDPEKKPE